MEQLQVMSPAGIEAISATSVAPRLDSLDGKTIGEVWNKAFSRAS